MDSDKNNFEAFASQAAIAIENSRLFSTVKEEKRKLEIVFKRIREGAVLTTPDGEIVLLNRSAKLYLEYEKFQFTNINQAVSNFSMKPPPEQVLTSDAPVVRFEVVREKPKKLYLDGSAIKLTTEDREGNPMVEEKHLGPAQRNRPHFGPCADERQSFHWGWQAKPDTVGRLRRIHSRWPTLRVTKAEWVPACVGSRIGENGQFLDRVQA